MPDQFLDRLPLSLVSSDDFRALSADQQQTYAARLCHCAEIAEAGLKAASGQDSSLLDAIDDIELDALSIMNSPTDSKQGVSSYIVHSSWTFACDRQALAAHVNPEASEFLEASSWRLKASCSDARDWLGRWARVLQAVLRRLSTSSSFTEAIAQLILIDALVASYLVFAATVRLNARIS